MKKPRIVAAILAIALLAGCGSDNDVAEPDLATDEDRETSPATNETTTTTTTEPESATEAIRTYFDAIASGSARQLEDARAVAEPGSPADLYLRYHLASASVTQFPDVNETTYADGTVEMCSVDYPDEPCSTFEEIRSNDAGQIVTFKTAGHELGDRITPFGDPHEKNGITLTPIAAYQSQSDYLLVVFDLTNNSGGSVIAANYEATYIGADGRQTSSDGLAGMQDALRDGATSSDLLVFDSRSRPGTVEYSVYSDDFGTETVFELAIP